MSPAPRPIIALVLAHLASAAVGVAGPLDPPSGPIAPTPGPEPRTAINAATTPGDADSRFKITQPGSYYLTGNLTGLAGRHGIEIASSGVSVDLCGFEVIGGPATLTGIVTTTNVVNVHIRNGSLRSWGEAGVDLNGITANGCIVSDLCARANGSTGIAVGIHTIVARCVATNNGFDGISANTGGAISDCHASNNVGGGIDAANLAVITGCFAEGNGDVGIDCSNSATVTACTAAQNTGGGVSVASGCTITGCSAYDNGAAGILAASGCTVAHNTVRANSEDGIIAGTASFIFANNCSSNGAGTAGGAGVHVTGSDSRIEANNCVGQDRGIDVDVGGNIIVRNTCAGNTTNWSIAANNYYGPIIDRAGTLTAAVTGDAAGSTLASTDPNANFTY